MISFRGTPKSFGRHLGSQGFKVKFCCRRAPKSGVWLRMLPSSHVGKLRSSLLAPSRVSFMLSDSCLSIRPFTSDHFSQC
jgi:hypothetical protein